MRTQAAVLRWRDAPFVIEPIDLAEPGIGQILVRIVGTGLCHTDLTVRAESSRTPLPLILGHEGAGVVEAIGPGISGIEVGDHVVLSFDSCGSCLSCLEGRPGFCSAFQARNFMAMNADGSSPASDSEGAPVAARWFGQSSFATHSLATRRNCVVVDRSLPLDILGPLGCGILTGAGTVLVAMHIRPGSTVVVFGTGAVGLAAIMAAKVACASQILAIDIHESRLELARELGATDAILSKDLATSQFAEMRDADYAIDTSGSPLAQVAAVRSLRRGGVCSLIAQGRGNSQLDTSLLMGGRTVMGVVEGNAVPQSVIPMLAGLWKQGSFPFDRLIRKYPLRDINQAERAAVSGEVVKPVLLME